MHCKAPSARKAPRAYRARRVSKAPPVILALLVPPARKALPVLPAQMVQLLLLQ